MKNKIQLLLLIVWCCSIQISTAQTSQQLDINNINARINTKGFLFNNPYTFKAGFEAPKGSGKHSIFISNLWMGNATNLAASTYYIDSCDFSNGPLTTFGTAGVGEAAFNKVWKVSKAEIDYHIGVTTGAIIDPSYVIPSSIATWPAHGYVYDMDYATYLAPFVDVDTDNTYNPSSGDYPRIKGDMATYIIYNDYSTVPHKLSGGQSIGVEIHQMAYAFGCTSNAALNNTIFVEYKVINRTANTYPDFYFGMWSDIDIGNSGNEFVECDVNRSCYFQYNNNGTDANSGSTLGYGVNHPTQGVVILAGPWLDPDGLDNSKTLDITNDWCPNGLGFEDGILDNERWGLTGFMHNNTNGLAWQATPVTATQFHGVMKSYWPDNTYLRYGGWGHDAYFDYNVPSKFAYPGSSDPNGFGTSGVPYPFWNATSVGQLQTDEKSVGSMGPVIMVPGEVQQIELAYVFAQDVVNAGVQPGKDLFFQYVDEIKNLYTNGNLYCTTTSTVEKVKFNNNVVLFPNPASDKLYINGLENNHIVNIRILAVDGKLIKELTSNTRIIDLNEIETGIYFIEITTDDNKLIKRIMKN
jgi:hypothetical protein